MEAVCMDFQKNLPVPNITSNDVYYKRQLPVYSFNVHVLASNKSVFYAYPQTVGRKGADNVSSMSHHFVCNFVAPEVEDFFIFANSCGGQNKNYTVVRLAYHLVHVEKRFKTLTIIFPMRGHSYMEPDKNIGLMNQKMKVELPTEWADVFRTSRRKPFPFEVVEADQELFKSWSKYFEPKLMKKCPFQTRPIRVMKVDQQQPFPIFHRSTYYGGYASHNIIPKKKETPMTIELPECSNTALLPISKEKYDNVNALATFCSAEAKRYFEDLPHT